MSTAPTKKPPQIVAMGGGGFSMERIPLLDDYVLSLASRPLPRVCFVPTASGDALGYIEKFRIAFRNRAETSHLALFSRGPADLEEFLLSQDIIYVGGGNTANMLAIWRIHGVDRILRAAWRHGVILVGISAGMICWFEAGVTDSFGPLAPLRDGLGFLPGSACPHFDGEAQRRPAYHSFVSKGFPSGIAADDGAALHFVGRKLNCCVSSRENASAYRIQNVDGKVVETPIPTRFLGVPKSTA